MGNIRPKRGRKGGSVRRRSKTALQEIWPTVAKAMRDTFGYGSRQAFYARLGTVDDVKKYFTGKKLRPPSQSVYEKWVEEYSKFAHERNRERSPTEWKNHI